MDFDSAKPHSHAALDFTFHVFVILVDRHKASQLGMLFAFRRDEVIDRLNLSGAGRDRMHDEAIDGRVFACFQKASRCSVAHIHGNVVELTNGINRFRGDLFGINMTMTIDDVHSGKTFLVLL